MGGNPSPHAVTRRRSNDPCWCGSGKKLKRCHGDHGSFRREPTKLGRVSPSRKVPPRIARPDYVATTGVPSQAGVERLSGSDLERLRRACHVAARVLEVVGESVATGVTTDELDECAHGAYLAFDAYPSTLGYRGFPKGICTSVNEVVCHGIPDDRPLVAGDIVNVDVTAYLDGMHGDTSATFAVGAVDVPTTALVDTTFEAMLKGIEAVGPGRDIAEIGRAIQPLAFARGLGVVRDIGGHGIGRVFHTEPHIFHSIEQAPPFVLEPGMAFTVEPMLTAGTAAHHMRDDGWTIVTDDLLPSAQFEHTVVVTEDGVEIPTYLHARTMSSTSRDLMIGPSNEGSDD